MSRVREPGSPVQIGPEAPAPPRVFVGSSGSSWVELVVPLRARRQAVASSSTSRLRVRLGSTGTPGPIVVVMVAFLT